MLPTAPRALRSRLLSLLPVVVVFTSPAQLDNQLLGRVFQGGCAAVAAPSTAACEPATELPDGGDDQMRKSIVGQRGDELVPLGAGQSCGQHVDAVA